jgi:hypothetical protein
MKEQVEKRIVEKSKLLTCIGTQASFIDSLFIDGATIDEVVAKVSANYPSLADTKKCKQRIRSHLNSLYRRAKEGLLVFKKDYKTGKMWFKPVKKEISSFLKVANESFTTKKIVISKD